MITNCWRNVVICLSILVLRRNTIFYGFMFHPFLSVLLLLLAIALSLSLRLCIFLHLTGDAWTRPSLSSVTWPTATIVPTEYNDRHVSVLVLSSSLLYLLLLLLYAIYLQQGVYYLLPRGFLRHYAPGVNITVSQITITIKDHRSIS